MVKNRKYMISWKKVSPGILHCGDYCKGVDDNGKKFEGVISAPTPYTVKHRPGLWFLFFEPKPGNENQKTTSKKVRVGQIRRQT